MPPENTSMENTPNKHRPIGRNLFDRPVGQIEDELKRRWKCSELTMVGQYSHSFSPEETGYGYIQGPYINDRMVVYPNNDHSKSVSIRVTRSDGLVEGEFYRVRAKLGPIELRRLKNNPYLLVWDDSAPLVHLPDFESPKTFIRSWFRQTGSTPKDAATIASQLKLNSLELYTQTERFIFELIQNADDMPSSHRGVRVEMHLLDNHLVFRHNGKFFDRNDVRAIADAARSNKSEDVRQTGYKGIGFKSVFTDSACVYIRSGSYSFKFDRDDPVYSDFWSLYAWHADLLGSRPRELERFRIDYEENRGTWEDVDNIPWQIKPIWVEWNELPEELAGSAFSRYAEVNIALRIGEATIRAKNYDAMISGILARPRFMLFLRNTQRFEYFGPATDPSRPMQSISLVHRNRLIEIIHNGEPIATYTKIQFDVAIGNGEFAEAGFNIEKFEDRPGRFRFRDGFGELKSIPEKLCMLEITGMTFASEIREGRVVALDRSYSILYNYLPTSDQRFGFRFLVNADFITNTSREFILKENLWNHYLMYHIGRNFLGFLTSLVSDDGGKANGYYAGSYLDLLPDSLLDEDDDELAAINRSFNRGLVKGVEEYAFIVDEKGCMRGVDGIVLDLTGVSRVLGTEFFMKVTETDRSLPSPLIQNPQLLREYLPVGKYDAESLVGHLGLSGKRDLLSVTITNLDDKGYLRFIDWLDQFCRINGVDDKWLLGLPVVRFGGTVISLSQALSEKGLFIRFERTREIEPLLRRLGLALSEFTLEVETLSHIRKALFSTDTYLKNDRRLYSHMTEGKDMSVLDPSEKAGLIGFLKQLYNVGPSDYAADLRLFKSDTGVLRPLNRLISSVDGEGLPQFMSAFVIDGEEEKSLEEAFRKEMVRKADVLVRLFCNKESYDEISAQIADGETGEFYDFIASLPRPETKDLPRETSSIPWIFCSVSSSFEAASSVFFPESLTRLGPEKYASVKGVMESVFGEAMPHFSSLRLKGPLSLGGKPVKLENLTPKEVVCDLTRMNDFLDWAEANGEDGFFRSFTISETEGGYMISRSGGTLQYHTSDESLVGFIGDSSIASKMSLLPHELHSKGRERLGLLEGTRLLRHLVESGEAKSTISRQVQSANDPELTLEYLEGLDALAIRTDRSYKSEDDEFRILRLVVDHIVSDTGKLNRFRARITVDGLPLLDRAISEDIHFREAGVTLKTGLSEILPSYRNRAFPISRITSAFESFGNRAHIVAVFKEQGRTPKMVLQELLGLNPSLLDPAQTFFLSYYRHRYPEDRSMEGKVLFTASMTRDPDAFKRDAARFLDICLAEESYTGFVGHGVFPDFNPAMLVSVEEYATEFERIPDWFAEWLKGPGTEDRETFVRKLGVNDAISPVVMFRQAIREGRKEDMNRNRELVSSSHLLLNTLQWLSIQTVESVLVIGKGVLKPIFERLHDRKISTAELPFPFLRLHGADSYGLSCVTEGEKLHLANPGWGPYAGDIFSIASSCGRVTDDVLPKRYLDDWKVIDKPYEKRPDVDELQRNSRPFEAPFYTAWPSRDVYPIRIYEGEALPHLITYDEETVARIMEGDAACVNGDYYVTETRGDMVVMALRHVMVDSAWKELGDLQMAARRDLQDSQDEGALSERESEVLRRLFANGIPEALIKDINLAACVSALIFLDEKGWDVSKAEKNLVDSHKWGQIGPVFDPASDMALVIMCRSAINGILYLAASSWHRLDRDNVRLFVKTGQHDTNHRMFHDKAEVMSASDTKYQVFRVKAQSDSATTDSILAGDFPKDRVILILKMRDNEVYRSIFNGDIRRNAENPDIDNLQTDEDSPY
jgi:hypothetical protein